MKNSNVDTLCAVDTILFSSSEKCWQPVLVFPEPLLCVNYGKSEFAIAKTNWAFLRIVTSLRVGIRRERQFCFVDAA